MIDASTMSKKAAEHRKEDDPAVGFVDWIPAICSTRELLGVTC